MTHWSCSSKYQMVSADVATAATAPSSAIAYAEQG